MTQFFLTPKARIYFENTILHRATSLVSKRSEHANIRSRSVKGVTSPKGSKFNNNYYNNKNNQLFDDDDNNNNNDNDNKDNKK